MTNLKDRKVDPSRGDIESHFKYLIEDPLMESWKRYTQGSVDADFQGGRHHYRGEKFQKSRLGLGDMCIARLREDIG
jgi:hypothetical protein